MCGIVAYLGNREAYPVLIKGLHRLEYRGYDSAGVAMISKSGELNVYKKKGKVSDLEEFAFGKDLSGSVGIGHTRWATHGEPNDVNSHPHFAESGDLVIIHNGIDGQRLFGVKLSIDDKVIAKARATSKKKAEEKASQRAYFAFQEKIDNK